MSSLASGRRPNILYLHSHDTGRYVQPYGHPVPTPNIQRLAEVEHHRASAFPGAKAALTDRGLGVLLMMRGPGGLHDGRVSTRSSRTSTCEIAFQGPVLPMSTRATQDLLVEHGWAGRPLAREELYDLVFDPGEAATWPATRVVRTCSRRCASACTSGLRRPATRCSRAPSTAAPSSELNRPDQRSPSDPTFRVEPVEL